MTDKGDEEREEINFCPPTEEQRSTPSLEEEPYEGEPYEGEPRSAHGGPVLCAAAPSTPKRPLLPRLTHTWPRLAIQPFLTCSPNLCSSTCSRGCRVRPRPTHSTHAPVLAPCSTPRDQTSLRSSMRLSHARASRGAPVHVSHPHTAPHCPAPPAAGPHRGCAPRLRR